MLLPFPEQNLPTPGQVLPSGVTAFPHAAFTQLSIRQGIQNSTGDAKDFLWTTDLETELPIRLVDDGEFGAYPPATVIEVFANVVRQFPDLPALAWKQVNVVQSLANNRVAASAGETTAVSAAEPDRSTKASKKTAPDGSLLPAEVTHAAPHSSSVGVEMGKQTAQDGGQEEKETVMAPQQKTAVDNKWYTITWQSYWDDVCAFAKALIAAGVENRDRVAIMGYNSAEWAVAHFGSIFCNAVSASIYSTNNVEATTYVLAHSACRVAVCDTVRTLDKFLAAKDSGKCPDLKYIVHFGERLHGLIAREDVTVYSWSEFMTSGSNVHDVKLTSRMEAQRPGMCCSLVYTSGTTGVPKGVMLSHDNMTWTSLIVVKSMNFTELDSIVSFLPLSHIAPQIIDLYLSLHSGMTTYFAQPDALKGSLLQTLQEVRPTWFFAVPRVWEKMEERIRQKAAKLTGIRRKLFNFGRNVGRTGTLAIMDGKPPPALYAVAKALVLQKVRNEIGLSRCKAFASGAAALPRTTQEFFVSLGIVICDLFGMSESSGPQNCNLPYPHWFKLGSSGVSFPGTEVQILDPDENGIGEFCFRGRNVFMGYYNNETATRETIDKFGFIHSGDTACFDSDGFLFIKGRIKELLITTGGENIPPLPIETNVKDLMPFVSNCQVIGDRRRFLTLLLCLHTVPDEEGNPTTNLTREIIKMLQDGGSGSRTTTEAMTDPVLNAIIQNDLKKVNERAISRPQMLQNWRILQHDFTIAGGEMTPTLKLKRNVVIQKYSALIDAMYRELEETDERENQRRRRRSRL